MGTTPLYSDTPYILLSFGSILYHVGKRVYMCYIYLLSVLGDKLGQERAYGMFYMLLQSEDDIPSEVGLNSVFCKVSNVNDSEERVIENNFRFKPAPVSGRVTCMSMSSGHAAVVNDDNKSVSTWGRGEDGALGLEEHLISNFDPPFSNPCNIDKLSSEEGMLWRRVHVNVDK